MLIASLQLVSFFVICAPTNATKRSKSGLDIRKKSLNLIGSLLSKFATTRELWSWSLISGCTQYFRFFFLFLSHHDKTTTSSSESIVKLTGNRFFCMHARVKRIAWNKFHERGFKKRVSSVCTPPNAFYAIKFCWILKNLNIVNMFDSTYSCEQIMITITIMIITSATNIMINDVNGVVKKITLLYLWYVCLFIYLFLTPFNWNNLEGSTEF